LGCHAAGKNSSFFHAAGKFATLAFLRHKNQGSIIIAYFIYFLRIFFCIPLRFLTLSMHFLHYLPSPVFYISGDTGIAD
jgi:hypothetical protein